MHFTEFHKILIIFIYIICMVEIKSQVFINKIEKIENVTLSEFNVKVRYINKCDSVKGVSRKYTAQYVSSIKHNGNEEEIVGHVYVPQNQKIVKGILNPGIWKNGGYKSVFNKTSQSPCLDPLFSIPLFLTYRADIHCNVKKGNYTIHGLYPNKLAHLTFGDKFIIGRSQVILKYLSKNSIFYCIEVIADIVPITASNIMKIGQNN